MGVGTQILVATVALVILPCCIKSAHAFAFGAPLSQCKSLLPVHGIAPQNTSVPVPYNITLDNTTVKPGGTVHVTLSSKAGSTPFHGFMAKGAKYCPEGQHGEVAEAFGTFRVPLISMPRVQTLDCFGVPHTGVTHTDPNPKTKIEFDWIAPDKKGEFVVLVTFVKDFDTIWARVASDKITVE